VNAVNRAPLTTMVAAGAETPWGLVLAGGDGTRLRPLTRRIAGDERPKQFCRVLSGETLLEQTLRRTARLLAPERTLAVVVRAHESFYAPLLAHLASPRLVVQPENRGTAPAILYGAPQHPGSRGAGRHRSVRPFRVR
jgi:mannose-1-phosphate guanylyltransferase